MCEQHILAEALATFHSHDCDYTFYIEGNNQQMQVDQLYERTTQEILDFWKLWKSDNIDLSNVMTIGREISRDVHLLKQLTKQLEESLYIRKTLHKYHLYAFFHQKVLHDPLTANNMFTFIKNAMLLSQKAKNSMSSGGV